jgi:alpha-tubulin suppressor-like RCC1 family protein
MKPVLVWLSCSLLVLAASSVASAGPSVAAGSAHSVVLTDTGTVWAWGYNANGQLGDGSTTTRSIPTWVSSITGVTAIAAGDNSTYALKTDGTVWAWGANSSGQLGDGTQTDRVSPVTVSGLTNVIAIAAGKSHAIALKGDGTVWTWGANAYGQLGDNTTTTRTTPIQVTTLSTSVVAISAHGNNSHAVKTDGTLWSWGDNYWYAVGDGTFTTRTTPVQTSNLTSVAVAGGGWAFPTPSRPRERRKRGGTAPTAKWVTAHG